MSLTDGQLLRRTAVVTLGRIVLLGCWFIAMILSYRVIGAEADGLAQAGLLALGLAGMKMFSSALSDPLDTDILRQVPLLISKDEGGAIAVWRSAQQLRLLIAAVIMTVAVSLAGPIAEGFLGGATHAPVVILAGAGASLEILFRGYLADCQSRNRFARFLAYEAGLQALRIAGLMAVAFVVGLGAQSFLMAYAAATALMLLVTFLLSGRARQSLFLINRQVTAKSLKYLRWVAPAMLLSAVVERLDLFLLTTLHGPVAAGAYGALLPLLLVPEVIAGFATHALQPRISEMQEDRGFLAFWANLLRFTVPVAIAAWLVVLFFAETLISLSIGPAYLASADVLRVLSAAVLLWVGVVPVALALVVMARPRLTLAITLLQACVLLVAGLWFIPSMGALGAAFAVLAMRLAAGAMICAAALVPYRRALAA